MLMGSVTVNQSISVSFDPSKLACVSCKNEHKIVSSKPLTIFFSDQNFVATMSNDSGDCLNIARMEDASLSHLLNLAKEMFEKLRVPEGSVFLFRSMSFLSRVGTSTYAKEWVSVVSHASSLWRGIRICPLIPLIITQCPGTVAREIHNLSTWLESVYDNNPARLLPAWSALVTATESCSVGAATLGAMDANKVPLPTGLSVSSSTQSTTFCSNRLRPVTLKGLPKDNLGELLSILISTIHSNFQTCASPEKFLERTTQMVDAENCKQKVVLVGASNLRNSASHFSSAGYEVVDYTEPGCVASPENIKRMSEKINKGGVDGNHLFIFDLFGNTAFRFEQYDGTQSLPYKVGSKYHLGGNIVLCAQNTFKKIVESSVPLIETKKSSVGLIVPPLPRYLFNSCCDQKSHCTNVSEPNHPQKILSDVIDLRNQLKKILSGVNLSAFRVLDSCCIADCETTSNIETRLNSLQKVNSADGVHYLAEGYRNLVKSCLAAAAVTKLRVGEHPLRPQSIHFWRGFRSPVGARCYVSPNPVRGNFRGGSFRGSNRGRNAAGSRHFHPYRRN
jgi:hypothetical protein